MVHISNSCNALGAAGQPEDEFMKTTNDETEPIRRDRLVVINSMVESHDPEGERARLQAQQGKVWDTAELRRHFTILGISAPYVVAHCDMTKQRI